MAVASAHTALTAVTTGHKNTVHHRQSEVSILCGKEVVKTFE